MLLQNGTLHAQYPYKRIGGSSLNTAAATLRSQLGIRNSTQLTPFASMAGYDDKSSTPVGYGLNSVLAPLKSGGIAVSIGLDGNGQTTSVNLVGGRNAESTISGEGEITTADLRLLIFFSATVACAASINFDITGGVSPVASISGSSDLDAELGSINGILASITATASVTGSLSSSLNAQATIACIAALNSSISGAVQIVSSMSGAATVSPVIKAKWEMLSTITGQCTVVGAIKATAHLISTIIGDSDTDFDVLAKAQIAAEITPFTDLSPQGLASAIWNSLADEFNSSGTMGQKINSAASAGDPWITELPGTYPPGSAGDVIGKKILKLVKLIPSGL